MLDSLSRNCSPLSREKGKREPKDKHPERKHRYTFSHLFLVPVSLVWDCSTSNQVRIHGEFVSWSLCSLFTLSARNFSSKPIFLLNLIPFAGWDWSCIFSVTRQLVKKHADEAATAIKSPGKKKQRNRVGNWQMITKAKSLKLSLSRLRSWGQSSQATSSRLHTT